MMFVVQQKKLRSTCGYYRKVAEKRPHLKRTAQLRLGAMKSGVCEDAEKLPADSVGSLLMP